LEDGAMHNLDQSTLESNEYAGEYEGDELEYGGGELGGEYEGGGVNEQEVMELASELMGVGSEQELEYFLGNLIKKAASGIKSFAGSSLGKTLIGGIKNIAKQALPSVGAALGNLVAPGIGGAIGSKLAAGAGSALGLELEGLSAEDREFEVAKQVIRLGKTAARAATQIPPSGSPQIDAQKALVQAARVHAPALVPILAGRRFAGARAGAARGASGRWFRRGNSIVLVGA
jgi:hypothetical protein